MKPASEVPRASPWRTLAFLSRPARFSSGPGHDLGDPYTVRVAGRRIHVITDPAMADELFVGPRADSFEKHAIYWRELYRVVGPAMGSVEGHAWEVLDRQQQPFFTSHGVGDHPRTELEKTAAIVLSADGRFTGLATLKPSCSFEAIVVPRGLP